MEVLAKVPRELWGVEDGNGNTLLRQLVEDHAGDHRALATLLAHGVPLRVDNGGGSQPVDTVIARGDGRALELFLARGYIIDDTSAFMNDLDWALGNSTRVGDACVYVLIANGARLSAYYGVEFVPFQQHVIDCRRKALMLLSIKRHRGANLRHVDRFLFREMALAVWAERYHF